MNINYKKYLLSKKWLNKKKELRDINFTLYGFVRCGLCGCKEDENKKHETHHKTYERLGDERISDLILLCKKCHKLVTIEENRCGKISLSWWRSYENRFKEKWINKEPDSLNTFVKNYKDKKSIKSKLRKKIKNYHKIK